MVIVCMRHPVILQRLCLQATGSIPITCEYHFTDTSKDYHATYSDHSSPATSHGIDRNDWISGYTKDSDPSCSYCTDRPMCIKEFPPVIPSARTDRVGVSSTNQMTNKSPAWISASQENAPAVKISM